MSLSLKLEVERKRRLLCTGVHADVHFLVGEEGDEQELLPAHKIVLRMASDVFDAMFRLDDESAVLTKKGEITESSTEVNNSGHVRVPDVDVETFKAMLDFIYTDNLSGVNGKNAIDVLYIAKKYNLPMLVKACVDIPISELDNVFIAFAKARLLDEKFHDFAGRCLAYIDRNADTLIKSDEFLQIDQQLLCELLGRDQLVVNGEIAIWNAALRWADEQCRQNGLSCKVKNRRQMLGPALFQIRFPIIHKDFFEDNASSGLLTSAELVSVLLYHSGNSPISDAMSKLYPLPFPIHQRSEKTTGKLTLKIEKFSEFSQEDELSEKHSEAVYIGGFQWKIYAEIRKESDIKYLGVYIKCCANYEFFWKCSCSATFRIVSQKQGKSDYATTTDRTYSKASSCGYPRFKSFMEVMDPNNGWYLEEEDTVILNAFVTV